MSFGNKRRKVTRDSTAARPDFSKGFLQSNDEDLADAQNARFTGINEIVPILRLLGRKF